ncbi:MAG: hypothetical protein ACFB9M_13185 [Myxococcota bacterium]
MLAALCLAWGIIPAAQVVEVQMRADPEVSWLAIRGDAPPDFSAFVAERPHRVVIEWADARIEEPSSLRLAHPWVSKVDLENRLTETEPVARITVWLTHRRPFRLRARGHEIQMVFEGKAPVTASNPASASRAQPSAAAEPPVPKTEAYIEVPSIESPQLAVPSFPDTEAPALDALPAIETDPRVARALAEAEARAQAQEEERRAEEQRRQAAIRQAALQEERRLAELREEELRRDRQLQEELRKAETTREALRQQELRRQREELRRVALSALKTPDLVSSAPVSPPSPEENVPQQPAKRTLAAAQPEKRTLAAGPEPEEMTDDEVEVPDVTPTRPPAGDLDSKPATTPRALASWAPPEPQLLARHDPTPGASADRGSAATKPSETRSDPPGPALSLAEFVPAEPPETTVRLMTDIGFRLRAPVSRVFVRLDGTARYRTRREDGIMILTLVNTRVNEKNNELPLDTSYFESPVSMVQAVSRGRDTDVVVRLRKAVPWSVKRIGTTIAVDFTSP